MKKIVFAIVSIVILMGCSGENSRNRNPYLPDYSFSFLIDTNLPLYSGLNSPVNPKIVTDPSSGTTLIVMKVSDTDYRAWDINCPNQSITSCSRMTINGVNAKCSCDDVEYSIFTGVGAGQYPMKGYRVEVLGTRTIRVYN